MSEDYGNCPNCGSDMKGEQIPEEYLRKEYYGKWDGSPRYYSRKIGVNIPGVYNGCLFWTCPDCGYAWHRFPEMSHLGFLAAPFIRSANSRFSSEVSGK